MTATVLPVASGRQTWAWLLGELRRRAVDMAATLLVGLLGAAASVVPAYALGVLVDRVRAGAPTSAIVPVAVVIGVAAIAGGAATGLSAYLIGRLGARVLAALRERTVERALHLPPAVLERAGKGDLLSRVGADVAAVGKAASDVIPTMLSSVLLGVLSVAAMAGIDWRLGLAGALAIPLYTIALRWYLPRSAPGYASERKAIAERAQLLVESMQGRRTVHAYRLGERHLRDIDAASGRARDISVAVFTLFTRFVGRINRAEFVGLAAILAVGYALVERDAVTVGETAAAAVLFHRLFNPIGMLLFTFDEVQAAGASLARLVGVESRGPLLTENAVKGPPPNTALSLELDGVCFSYDGRAAVLHEVSLRIEPGERVALVGSTGAGKSTVAAIAAGILRPDHGSARAGGVPVADLAARHRVAIISQETHVFAGPLVEDLRLARPGATVEEVTAALATVHALDWAQALPDGLDTAVGEGGHDLTPAQAQQLALARLVLLDPAVAILDEATAEAGSLGARVLEASAAAATRGRTTLVVAHRLTQAAAADRVIVLEHGRIVEAGTHPDLIAAGGRYAALWQAWQTRTPEELIGRNA